jgi:hypothetical protein
LFDWGQTLNISCIWSGWPFKLEYNCQHIFWPTETIRLISARECTVKTFWVQTIWVLTFEKTWINWSVILTRHNRSTHFFSGGIGSTRFSLTWKMLDAKLSSFQLKVIKWMIKLMFTGNCFFYGCWKLGFYCSLYVCKRLFSCFGDTDVCIIRTLYLRVCNLWWNEGSNEHYHVFLCRISFSYLTILCLTFLWHYLYTPESLSKKNLYYP